MSLEALAQDAHPAMEQPHPTDGAPGGEGSRQARESPAPKADAPAGVDTRPTKHCAESTPVPSGGAELAGRQLRSDTLRPVAASDQPADRQEVIDPQKSNAVGSNAAPGPAAIVPAESKSDSLLDQALAMAADVLDDIERVRMANENRWRQLTRSVEDKDGETRGFGLDESHPDVARLAAIVDMLKKVEHDATLNLKRHMRRHPLGPWMKAQRGIGEKQGARLLAAIGDPYIRPEIIRTDGTVLPAGPRTVSALWAYSGYHTLPSAAIPHATTNGESTADGANFPASQKTDALQGRTAGRDQPAARHSAHRPVDAQSAVVWVAARRRRGQKANWSTKAKMRAYLIAESCGKQLRKPCVAGGHVDDCQCSPYRLLYEQRKAATVDRLHAVACVRCGTSGKPAQPGTPWSDGHRHADALRIVAKRILRHVWREAKRIHETTPPGQGVCVTQCPIAGRGETNEDPPRVASADGSPTQTAQPWKETV